MPVMGARWVPDAAQRASGALQIRDRSKPRPCAVPDQRCTASQGPSHVEDARNRAYGAAPHPGHGRRARIGSWALAAIAAVIALARPVVAQDYPVRPITLVVPYAAGGGNDAMARTVADKMSRALGQQIVVENRGGAGGTIATRQVAKAAPDGYTLVIGGTGTLAVNPTLYSNVGYDPRKDFAPVGLIGTSALVVLVRPDFAAHSIRELIELAKREPGKLSYASAGVGSGIHLATVLFEHMADATLTHVPYRGTGPALTDLLGGHVAVYFSSLPSAVALVRDGKVRALGITGAKRSPVLPDVPTVAQAGLPGYEAVLHYGIVAPAGTPRPIVEKLNAALRTSLAAPETQQRMAAEGTEPLASSPEDYAADIDREETKWSAIVRRSGAKAQAP
jgi:tripartite-type tricarboxylate transporter receptor subunit TctC